MKRRWRALLAILCGCATLWLAASGWAKAAPTVTYNSCNGFEEEGMPVASIVMGRSRALGPRPQRRPDPERRGVAVSMFGYSLTAAMPATWPAAPLQEEGQRVERRLAGTGWHRPCPWLVVAVSETARVQICLRYAPAIPGFPRLSWKAAYQVTRSRTPDKRAAGRFR